MAKLTNWFNAKTHTPAHVGWYDCKECNMRHYFKDGLWYRDSKTTLVGSLVNHQMHWRGLVRPAQKSPSARDIHTAQKSSVGVTRRKDGRPSPCYRSSGGGSLLVVRAFKGGEGIDALKAAGILTESGKLSDEYSAPPFISKRDEQKQSNVFSKPMPDKPTVAQIFDFCEQLCGTQELAFGWMTGHCPALAGAPVKLMDTAEGREQVLRVIFGIYHSVYQ